MDKLAGVLDSKGVPGLVRSLLDETDASFDLEDDFASFLTQLSREAESSLVKMIADLA